MENAWVPLPPGPHECRGWSCPGTRFVRGFDGLHDSPHHIHAFLGKSLSEKYTFLNVSIKIFERKNIYVIEMNKYKCYSHRKNVRAPKGNSFLNSTASPSLWSLWGRVGKEHGQSGRSGCCASFCPSLVTCSTWRMGWNSQEGIIAFSPLRQG